MERPAFDVFEFTEELVKSKLCPIIGKSSQSLYLLNYLVDIKANTVLVEHSYIDKDYLMDYSNFYSRSFEVEKYTKRLHFFNEGFDRADFELLFENNENFIDSLRLSYLGFIVVKPIKIPVNNKLEPLIGRTVLQTYDPDDGTDRRQYLKNTYKVSLFGLRLEIQSLPFQAQDFAVAACATTALWIALHPLNHLFETQKNAHLR
ncbi:MAG: hypothetical protein SCH66_11130 [Methanolobus sp.]|nr:hypothetical protein [Methanolobus sp.]